MRRPQDESAVVDLLEETLPFCRDTGIFGKRGRLTSDQVLEDYQPEFKRQALPAGHSDDVVEHIFQR